MLHQLAQWDKELLLIMNGSGNTWLDPVMLLLSHKWIWLPFYALLVFFIYKKEAKNSWLVVIVILLTVGLADFITSGLMKPFFERFRPCNDAGLQPYLRMVMDCRGKFGFVSSHAANTATLASFLFFWFRPFRWPMLVVIWSMAVGYSRIYLAMHYPGDVFVGWVIGLFLGFLAAFSLRRLQHSPGF